MSERIEFNLKKFLSLPLNDGFQYQSKDGSCGCIKGNFERSRLVHSLPVGPQYMAMSILYGQPIGVSMNSTVGKIKLSVYDRFNRIQWNQKISLLPSTKLQTVLDVGEDILLKGYPQKAKLYVAFMLKKHNLVDFVNADVATVEVESCPQPTTV